jgi:hypothetical protein
VETLVKMAGKDAQAPEFELSEPTLTEAKSHAIICKLRRGNNKLSFMLEFTIVDEKVVLMQNTRL